jgi:hypothetical protein
MIDYKFKENEIILDIKDYIDETYSSHYAQSQKQATEIIIDHAIIQLSQDHYQEPPLGSVMSEKYRNN